MIIFFQSRDPISLVLWRNVRFTVLYESLFIIYSVPKVYSLHLSCIFQMQGQGKRIISKLKTDIRLELYTFCWHSFYFTIINLKKKIDTITLTGHQLIAPKKLIPICQLSPLQWVKNRFAQSCCLVEFRCILKMQLHILNIIF